MILGDLFGNEYLRVIKNGTTADLVIGATTSQQRLDIHGNAILGAGTGGVAEVKLRTAHGTTVFPGLTGVSLDTNSANLNFYSVGSGVESLGMTLQYNGSVGIGITNPAAALHSTNSAQQAVVFRVDTSAAAAALAVSSNSVVTITNATALSQGAVFGPNFFASHYGGANSLVQTNGKLGIGMANPAVKVNAEDTEGTVSIRANLTANPTTGVGLSSSSISLRRNGSSTFGLDIETVLNNGSWGVGGGYISLSPNTVEAMRVLTNGNCGFGLTLPTAANHTTNAANQAVVFQVDSSAGAGKFLVQSNGNTYFGGTSNHFAGATLTLGNAWVGTVKMWDEGAGGDYHIAGVVSADGGEIRLKGMTTTNDPTAGYASFMAITNYAGGGKVELIAIDSDTTTTLLSPHADDAPAFMYVTTNWLKGKTAVSKSFNRYIPVITWENQHVLKLLKQWEMDGTNLTSFSPAIRAQLRQAILFEETFAAYEVRTGQKIVKLDWDTVQTGEQARYDAKRAAEIAARVAWTNAVAAWTVDMAARDAEVLVHNQWTNDFAVWKADDTLRLAEVAAHGAWVQWCVDRTNDQAVLAAWLVYSAERSTELSALAQWETNLVESIVFIPETQAMITNMVHVGTAPVVRAETPEPTVRAELSEPTIRATVEAPVEPSVRAEQAYPVRPVAPRPAANVKRPIPALLKTLTTASATVQE
jgi:hypothetical protein